MNSKGGKPSFLTQETGTIRKKGRGRFRVALVYPHTYRVGMSNLGFQQVYALLNQEAEVVCERFFLPESEDRIPLQNKDSPLISLESQTPLYQFDLIAFSLSFETDYPQILNLLEWGRIPLLARDRTEETPLVMAGGVAVFLNPEPIAPFMDLFLIGEAEGLLSSFIRKLMDYKKDGIPRAEILKSLQSECPGVYAPSLYEAGYHPDGRLARFYPRGPYPERISCHHPPVGDWEPACSVILTPNTEFAAMNLLEVGRGCPRGCRFCAASYIYRPPREHSRAALEDKVREMFSASQRFGLMGAALGDFPEIGEFARKITGAGGEVSFSSIRADRITPELAEILVGGKVRTLSLAPEAGSERLRRVLNKGLEEEAILQGAQHLYRAGLVHLKLYFMVGLPTEEEEDVEAIPRLVKRVRHNLLKYAKEMKRVMTLNLSLNSFVPKPHTPFQWVPMDSVAALKSKIRKIKEALRREPNVQVHADIPKWSYIQALLSRGDRRVGELLLKVHERGGDWNRALREVNLSPDFYVTRERTREEVFPWDFLDHGVDKTFLWEEYQKALRAEPSPPCVPEICRRCGAC
jgi:radical SAM family uncharacterized protein